MKATRRDFFGLAAAGAGVAATLDPVSALAQPRSPRAVAAVQAVCRRLAPLGWRAHLQRVAGLDIGASDLAAELGRPLARIDRTVLGFADFAPDATKGVEGGRPSHSLLFHAFASPEVIDPSLRGYPTLAEIEAVETYVYAAARRSPADLQRVAGDRELRPVVFALQYRPARNTVHGRHADMVYARIGVTRMGTVDPVWDGWARDYPAVDPARPYAFRTVPHRFAAFLAMKARPGQPGFPGAMDPADGDAERDFWIPVHKLFPGDECLQGAMLGVSFTSGFRNEKLRRFHRYLQIQGYGSEWGGEHLNRFPFVIENERIASLSPTVPGLVLPKPQPFVNRAMYQGRPLTFRVPGDWTSTPGVTYFSSGQILGGEADTAENIATGGYQETSVPDYDRSAPEYISLRHRVRPDGGVDDLNTDPRMMEIIRAGGYQAQHYIDFSGDGWVQARITGLPGGGEPLPAYCTVSPPDFFPTVSQHDLMVWWNNAVPAAIRGGLWAMPPYALSGRRMSPDIDLPIGFSIYDTTACAVVGAPFDGEIVPPPSRTGRAHYSGLPDNSPGVFDPGWDASASTYYNNPEEPLTRYLQNYGLGTPFVEDVKLCAALGSYWPAIAPDSTRSFAPVKRAPGFDYPWPTVVPLTDLETGIEPFPGDVYMPWDGIRGPRVVTREGRRYAAYANIERVDYITLPNRMTAARLALVGLNETISRVMACERAYWALGIHDPEITAANGGPGSRATIAVSAAKSQWALLSFKAAADDAERAAAERAAGAALAGQEIWRLHFYKPGPETPAPGDMMMVHVEMRDEVILYCDQEKALFRRGDADWRVDRSLPTV